MYNTMLVEGRGYPGFVGNGCCRREEYNFYRFPAPLPKEMKRLDTVELIIHTDEFIHPGCVRDRCCGPEPVIVKDEKKSFIIAAATNCLEPDTYYTLQIDREVPFDAFGLNTYVKVEPCGFFRGEVGLRYTKTVHEHLGEGYAIERAVFAQGLGRFEGPVAEERFEGGCGEEGGCGRGPIPADPAFPGQNYVGGYRHTNPGVLVPVLLDLHANIATGKNFSTNGYKVPGTGKPYDNRSVLYYNNDGKFVLSRNWRRRSDYA